MINMVEKKILFILGPAGSGKSTQADLISEKLGYKHIVESNLLKAEVAKGTKLGLELKAQMQKGLLVPFEITCEILFNEIDKTKSTKIIVDGFPREMDQAITLDYYIYKTKNKIQGLIYVDSSKEECLKRLMKRKREDDTKKAIKKRLDIYYKETLPVIKRFENKGLLIKVNGNREIEPINKDIINKLKKSKHL